MVFDGSDQLIDTLRLTDEQWRELSDQLDRVNPYETGQRRHERISYRKLAQIAVAIQQPNGQWAKYIVRSRDLSPSGIGFIHGSYIHTGSACRVILKDPKGQVVCLEGTVRRCDLVKGTAHNIGVQFREEINLNRFVSDDSEESSESERDTG
jgi:PilZ domain